MAAMVLSAVLRKLGEMAGSLIVKEGSRMFQLKENILWIESEMRYIRSYLEDVDHDEHCESRRVTELIRNIWDVAYDVEDIIDTYFPKLQSTSTDSNAWKRHLGWLKSSKSIRDFAVAIEGMKTRVEDINRARQTYRIKERSGRDGRLDTGDTRKSFPHIDDVNVFGLDEQIEELVAKALDEDSKLGMISITGMAGLGKTTLAKKVYNSVRQRFQCSAWIYVSQKPNVNELLQDIARQVGLKEDKCEHNVEANLFEFLSQKRYVIVIDDVWDIKPWNALKNGIPTNSEKGNRIIITSRNKNVGFEIGLQVSGKSYMHELQPLDRKNSKKLFFKMIMAAPINSGESSDTSQLENIGVQILEKCHGVPLAIVVTAGILLSRERTKHAWNGVLESMGQLGEDQYSDIFALSYKDLPTKLKPCFLYFGLFPEDYKISSFELINLWAAEGLIRGSEGTEVEDIGDDYLNHLISRNLIQVDKRRFNGKVQSCRIHDILHSLCIQEAKEINFFNTQNDVTSHNSGMRVRRVTTHGSNFDDSVSLNHQTPKLRAMLSFGRYFEELRMNQVKGFLRRNQVKGFLRGSKFLRVLFVRFYIPRSLPIEIGNLTHLSYLGISAGYGTVVELPYTISKLKCLLTIDLRRCHKVLLPNVIWNMKQLRHILLPLCCWAPSFCGVDLDRFHPIEISLPNLCTLYCCGDIFKVEWLHRLTNLKTLRVRYLFDRIIEVLSDATPISVGLEELRLSNDIIRWRPEKVRTLNLSQYENLRNLHMNLGEVEELPQHDKLPPNLTKLTLEGTSMGKGPMETLKGLQKLKILKLSKFLYLGKESVCSIDCDSFPQLEVLEIKRAQFLDEFIVEEGGMPKLKDFTFIDDCCRTGIIMTLPHRLDTIMKFIE